MSKTITLENPITAIGRFFARRSILKMQKKIAKLEAKYFNEEASENTTETKQEATKTETKKSSVQTVLRHFLIVASNKKDVTKDLQKITKGKKVNWKKATSGLKNWYVSSIENMPSNEVDEVMAQYKSYNKYFNKGKWTARIWSSQK